MDTAVLGMTPLVFPAPGEHQTFQVDLTVSAPWPVTLTLFAAHGESVLTATLGSSRASTKAKATGPYHYSGASK
jgi:hypothetical protein